MCKINGHSLFTYIAQPHKSSQLLKSKQAEAKAKAITAEAEEAKQKFSEGDEVAATATAAKQKKYKNQTLSSLKVPMEGSKVGASVGAGTPVGLNLGG